MKKMIGFGAVALCAAVACADVTSANIVGYETMGLNANNTAAGATFLSVGTDGFKLSSLVLSGVSDTATVAGTINIQTLDKLGNKDKKYTYYQNVKGGEWKDKKGWFDEDKKQITEDNDFVIPAGKGLWVKGLNNATLTFTYNLDENK